MSFLTPLFLAGLAALAVPILVHLTRHEQGKPLAFPSLMFLKRIPFEETSRRRLRNPWLLLLRLAALGLLVAAFARPFVRDGRLAQVGGAGPEEVVVLVDQSYSMELGGRWQEGVSMARSVVSGLGPGDRVSIVAFSEVPRLVLRSATEPGRAAAVLDTLRTTSLGTRLAPAVRLAASVLEASPLPRRRAVIVSDFQRAGWRRDSEAVFPEGTRVETLNAAHSDPSAGADNLALAGLELRRETANGRERMSVRARLVATGATLATGATIAASAASASSATSAASVASTPSPAPASSSGISAEVALWVDDSEVERATVVVPPAGSAPVAFRPFTLTRPFTRGEVRVADAALQSDNAVYFVASPGGGVRVVVADPLGSGESNVHLRQALGIAEGAGFDVRVIRGAPGAGDLEGTDLVILNGGGFPGGGAGDRLRTFVEDGGGLLIVLGERSRTAAAHADFLPAAVGPTSGLPGQPRRLGFVDYDHPVFEAFHGARSGDFSRAAFFRARSLAPTDGRVLARFDDGTPALVEGLRDKGLVLIWATGMDRLWNDLPLHSVYLPFVHRLAQHLGGQGELPAWHRAGATVNLAQLAEAADLPASADAPPVSLDAVAMDPHGGAVALDPDAPLLTLSARGIWEVRPPGERPDRPFALAANVDLAESDLQPLDLAEFAAAVGGTPGNDASTPPTSADGETDSGPEAVAGEAFEARQSFWRYLAVAAFVLLVLESLLGNRLSRSPSVAEPVRPRYR